MATSVRVDLHSTTSKHLSATTRASALSWAEDMMGQNHVGLEIGRREAGVVSSELHKKRSGLGTEAATKTAPHLGSTNHTNSEQSYAQSSYTS